MDSAVLAVKEAATAVVTDRDAVKAADMEAETAVVTEDVVRAVDMAATAAVDTAAVAVVDTAPTVATRGVAVHPRETGGRNKFRSLFS